MEMLMRNLRPHSKAPPHHRLSEREMQIFGLLCQGMTPTKIADSLCLSVKTISAHKTHIMEKLGFNSTAALVQYAIQHDLLSS